jgi:CubicO group peptidase (beta-lactamase class C family)
MTTRNRGTLRSMAVALAVAALAVGCSDDSPADQDVEAAPATATSAEATTTTTEVDPRAWPTDEWPTTDAAAAGIDQTALDALAADAEANGSRCLAVTLDGELVQDWYWKGSDELTESEAWSATKSVTATLVGIAQDEGHLDIDQPASDFITEWQGTPSEGVTIRNLISNDSGRFHDYATDYGRMAALERDKTAFSISLDQQFEPGTEWVYNNSAIQTLEAVLERATGTPVAEYATEKLFEPIGMDSHMTFDASGNALTFMGMQSTCLDLARFGLLYQRDGEWGDEQILSADFVAEATSPSQDLNPSYGFMWWLLGGRGGDTAAGQGDIASGGPEGFAALGLGDQVAAVFPDKGLVITRMGDAGNNFGVAQIAAWVHSVDIAESDG